MTLNEGKHFKKEIGHNQICDVHIIKMWLSYLTPGIGLITQAMVYIQVSNLFSVAESGG